MTMNRGFVIISGITHIFCTESIYVVGVLERNKPVNELGSVFFLRNRKHFPSGSLGERKIKVRTTISNTVELMRVVTDRTNIHKCYGSYES